jgi:hypothetical protein
MTPVPLIENGGDFVDFFVEHELTWSFVGFVAGVGIDVDGKQRV